MTEALKLLHYFSFRLVLKRMQKAKNHIWQRKKTNFLMKTHASKVAGI